MEAELLNGEFDQVEKISRLAAIRKQVWDAHRQVDEAREAARASQLELEAMYRQKLQLETRLAYYDEAANNLAVLDGEYDFLELVPLNEFLADNPHIDPEVMDPLEVLSARVDDEERRRIELFGQKIKLKEQAEELQKTLLVQKESLRFKGHLCRDVKLLVEVCERVGEKIIQ